MTPDEQEAESRKYVPTPFSMLVLANGKIAVLEAYGAKRTLRAVLDREELYQFLLDDCLKNTARQRAPERRATPSIVPELDLSKIEIKL